MDRLNSSLVIDYATSSTGRRPATAGDCLGEFLIDCVVAVIGFAFCMAVTAKLAEDSRAISAVALVVSGLILASELLPASPGRVFTGTQLTFKYAPRWLWAALRVIVARPMWVVVAILSLLDLSGKRSVPAPSLGVLLLGLWFVYSVDLGIFLGTHRRIADTLAGASRHRTAGGR